MPKRGQQIVNARTGQRTVFLQTGEDTGGRLLQIESYHPAHSPPEPEHVHPFQASRCRVLSGSLHFSVAGTVFEVGEGQELEIPANTPHFFWNPSAEEAQAIQEFSPALTIGYFFEDYFRLSREGGLTETGRPRSLLRLSILLQAYDRDIRITRAPRFVQQAIAILVGPFARLLGYRAGVDVAGAQEQVAQGAAAVMGR